VEFENKQALTRLGNNLFDAGGQEEIIIEQPRMVQGAVENSNVNPVLEMNKMIEILRSYQMTQRMLQTDHERIRNAVQKLTSV
jgi:flagellar basal-body rod protein FlgF